MASIDIIQIYFDGEIEAAIDSYSLGHKTKSRRQSFKNELTMQYGTTASTLIQKTLGS